MRKDFKPFSPNPIIHKLAKFIFQEGLTVKQYSRIESQLNSDSELQRTFQSVWNGIEYFELTNYQQFVGMDKANYIHDMQKMMDELRDPILASAARPMTEIHYLNFADLKDHHG